MMCAVADNNVWKDGKRHYKIASRDFLGMGLTVRCKFNCTALLYNGWRIGFDDFYARGLFVKDKLTMMPMWTSRRETVPLFNSSGKPVGKRIVTNVDTNLVQICVRHVTPDIPDVRRFEKDWTLIRMCKDDWVRYVV